MITFVVDVACPACGLIGIDPCVVYTVQRGADFVHAARCRLCEQLVTVQATAETVTRLAVARCVRAAMTLAGATR